MSYVLCLIFREYAKFATLDGQLSVRGEDKHIVEHLIMYALRSLKALLTIAVWISGVWGFWHTKCYVEKPHFMT